MSCEQNLRCFRLC